jgi:hypothetical protein
VRCDREQGHSRWASSEPPPQRKFRHCFLPLRYFRGDLLSSRPAEQQWNGDPLGTVGDEAARAVAMERQAGEEAGDQEEGRRAAHVQAVKRRAERHAGVAVGDDRDSYAVGSGRTAYEGTQTLRGPLTFGQPAPDVPAYTANTGAKLPC